MSVAWAGFDNPKSMGRNETGGRVALPIWIDYMASAIESEPEAKLIAPQGITAANIDPNTGLRDLQGTATEYFFREQLPPQTEMVYEAPPDAADDFRDQLF